MSLLSGPPHRALPRRACLALAATAFLVLMMDRLPPQGLAQSNIEGTVWLTPPISMVPAETGPFTVFVVLEDLQHFGVLSYDDDRDTVPDRQVESVGLGAFEVTIQYDDTVLAFTAAGEGPDLGRSGRSFQCLPPALELDSVSFGCVSPGPEPSGPQGTMTLAALTFQPIGTGTSPLVLEAAVTGPLGADTVPIETRGGIVRVAGRPAPIATARPGDATPSASGTTTASNVGITPALTALGETPGRPGSGTDPDDLITGGQDGGNGRGPSASNDGSSGRTAVWLGVALGGATAATFLTLVAVFWRRSRRTET